MVGLPPILAEAANRSASRLNGQGKSPFALGLNTSFIKHDVDEGKRFEKEAGYELPAGFWVEWALRQEGAYKKKIKTMRPSSFSFLKKLAKTVLFHFLR